MYDYNYSNGACFTGDSLILLSNGSRKFVNQLNKGDNLILAAFGGGFTWGSIYLKWAYDSKK